MKLGLGRRTGGKASRIVGQGYSQAGTFWGALNVSLHAYGAQLESHVDEHGDPTDLP